MSALQIEINPQAIRYNIAFLQKQVTPAQIVAVIKEDAYGHDMVAVAKICETETGIAAIAVISVEEGCRLRQEGITKPIYLLARHLRAHIPRAIENDLIIPLSTIDDILCVHEYLHHHPLALAHTSIAINTGMNRYGFPIDTLPSLKELLRSLPRMKIVQVYTHLTNADDAQDPYSPQQFELFEKALTLLQSMGLEGYKASVANSAALFRYPYMALDEIRTGCLLYGIAPIEDVPLPPEWPLETAYRCTSVVTHVSKVRKGEPISYGRTYRTEEDTYIGTISGGYGCGIPASLGNKGRVLIEGKSYPMVGRICMSQIMINLGPETAITPGQEVTILGKEGNEEITIYEIAEKANRNYLEILMNLSAHNTIQYKNT